MVANFHFIVDVSLFKEAMNKAAAELAKFRREASILYLPDEELTYEERERKRTLLLRNRIRNERRAGLAYVRKLGYQARKELGLK